MPDYTDAQKEIDDLAEKWQKDVEKKYNEIQSKYTSFQEEEILLPEETKKIRLDEIMELEVKAKELQKKRFGVEGDLFKKRKELIDPIQDKIYKAVKELSKDNNYSFILDKSKNSNIIYADPKYDKSDAVLRKINN
jgi:outer membrane protein